MKGLPDHNVSLWLDTTPESHYPAATEPVSVDVVVIGAGITGLTTAALLKEQGASVAVVEAGRVCSGVTGYTTAKVTSLHGMIYNKLTSSFGDDAARIYGEANQAAIERVAQFTGDLSIECDFGRMASYTYADSSESLSDIEAEVEAAQRLGLPASYTDDTSLPYEIAGAVKFEDQALFHPRKYCLGLAAFVDGDGSFVFEDTRAVGVDDGRPCTVKTENAELKASHVVLATQLPIVDKGLYFAKTHPERSYALAVFIEGDAPKGMYLGTGQKTRSIRPHPIGDQTLVLIGGEGHKTGQEPDTQQRYAQLEAWTRDNFQIISLEYRWSAQDYMPVDNLPYIGKLSDASDKLWVGTGFKKWGMTTGTVAAMIISDAIGGRDNPWREVFDSTRSNLKLSAKDFVKENANVVKRFVGDRISTSEAPALEEMSPGWGSVMEVNGEKVAVSKDDDGQVHAVSPQCTHMGCLVNWNTAERSWDCPCHGSRFDQMGRVIQGPAVEDLAPKELESDS